MAFKEVTSLDADVTISLGGFNKKAKKDNPKSVEGYYLGSKKVADQKKKSGYSFIHIFQTPEGNLGVWGKTDMDKKLQQVSPGTMTQVSHTSMRATPNGEMYVYTVAVDTDNTIEVGFSPEHGAPGDRDGYVSDLDETPAEEVEEEAPTPTVSAATRTAQAAKVQALLNRNKSK